MKQIRYSVAMSLDGYIAGPKGEYDWIIQDPEMDFGALMAGFDAAFIGRKTYEVMLKSGMSGGSSMDTYVFSRTLDQADHPQVKIVRDLSDPVIKRLRKGNGKDIWLFGGGELFRSLLGAGLVDRVEVSIIPVLLGEGLPLLLPPAQRASLSLVSHHVYKSGIVLLSYSVGRKRK